MNHAMGIVEEPICY